ncbi:hypothetical protein vBYenM531-1_37 [Yersinia phage vB_YenM_531]|nr:hypothetical protein vBYenM531-1_37 [Yersinia phage vB_YenM_531]QKN87472.1 hypothetical protein vBYenM281_037 [Yersinia phage vB_YenM_281]
MIISDELLKQIEALAFDSLDYAYNETEGLPMRINGTGYHELDESRGCAKDARKLLKQVLTPDVVIEIMRRYRALERIVEQSQEITKWQ